ncbi:MAG: polyprenyl synthetase family protein [Holosporales bacterium]|nr:polyprenyl synthetase family protein [Holosporales bacterium]
MNGKRMRSILFLNLTKRFHDSSMEHSDMFEKQVWTIALIESLHLASLIHDDIIDDNPSRRGVDSCQKILGRKFSVLFSDYIFAHTSKKFLRIHRGNQFIQNIFLKECSSTALGAVLEQGLTLESSIKECLRVASLKTSSFFKLSCFMGSYLSTNNFQLSLKAATFGTCFGIIYQIQNDLDCYKFKDSSESEDYIQQNITLPVLILNNSLRFNAFNVRETPQIHYEKIQEKLSSREFKVVLESLIGKYIEIIDAFLESML